MWVDPWIRDPNPFLQPRRKENGMIRDLPLAPFPSLTGWVVPQETPGKLNNSFHLRPKTRVEQKLFELEKPKSSSGVLFGRQLRRF